MLEVKIKIIGKTDEDIIAAIVEITEQIQKGFIKDQKTSSNGTWHFFLFDREETEDKILKRIGKFFVSFLKSPGHMGLGE